MEAKNDTAKSPAPFYFETKKGHSNDVTSIDVMESNNSILATSSDDKTIRMWDLRVNSSVKRYRDPMFKDKEMANVRFSKDGNRLYQACGNSVFEFDIKTDKILVENCVRSLESNSEEVNHVQIDDSDRFLAMCDDGGEVKIIDREKLIVSKELKGGHTNIAFTCDFINPGKKPFPYCVSSGFDCTLVVWDVETGTVFKKTNLNELFRKQVQGQLLSPPLVYNVTAKDSTILVSVETGHVAALNYKELNKAKYIIDAHLGRVTRSAWCRFDESKLVTVGTDKSFALWDIVRRDSEGSPSFLRRVQISNKPNWIETTGDKKILVADTSEYLYIYSLKE